METNGVHGKVHQILKDHLPGIWQEVALEDVKISKLSGGMTNLLYYCGIPDTIETIAEEPREVLVRIYGPSHSDTEVQLEIFKQLAKENLGPPLIAVFKGGRIEGWLPSNPLRWHEMTKPDVAKVVAQKIASIHHLTVTSLRKEHNWLTDKINLYNQFIETNRDKPLYFRQNVQESTKSIAREMMAIDFKPEIELLSKLIANSNEPLVFSHNDLHQNNILLMQNLDKDLYDRIVLIDFEYSSYNYRAFDIANHLSEWCIDYNAEEYPFFDASIDRFPSKDTQRNFLSHYLGEVNKLKMTSEGLTNYSNGHNENQESISVILDELQPFLMASNLLWAVWAVQSACTSAIDFGYWEMAKFKWTLYLECKNQRKTLALGRDGDLGVESSKM